MDAHDIEKWFVLLISLVLLAGVSYVSESEGISSITGEAIVVGGQCSQESTLYRMSSIDNGHAQLFDHKAKGSNDQDYPVSVCETEGIINRECTTDKQNDNAVLWLSFPSNAHVAKTVCDENGCRAGDEPNIYTQPVCYNNKFCIYVESGQWPGCEGIEGENVECFGSISGHSNAHVANCNVFRLNICCGDDELPGPPVGPGECDIEDIRNNVYWARDSDGNERYGDKERVEEGTPVWVYVGGGEDCKEKELDLLEIYEDDLLGEDLRLLSYTGDNLKFDSDGKISHAWQTIYIDDEFGDPEFYILAKMDADEEKSELIEVYRRSGGPGEECNRNGICEPEKGETNINCHRDDGGDCFCGDAVIAPLELCDIGGNREGSDDDILPKGKSLCSDHNPWSNSGDKRLKCSSDCSYIITNECECNEESCA